MDEVFCPDCRLHQPLTHRYCLRCGNELPTHLLGRDDSKRSRFFPGVRVTSQDPENAFLRVSCYRKEQVFEAPEGSVKIPGHHVRFSVWVGEEAKCVISVPETEALALARFMTDELGRLSDNFV